MIRVGIYDPYLDTLGGGERYILTIAEILQKNGYQVDIFWSGNQNILSQAESRFKIDLSNIKLTPDIFNQSHAANHLNLIPKITALINRIKVTKQYDLLFYISDWSIPFLFAKKNFLHVQVPFSTPTGFFELLINRLKLLNFSSIICNSKFTQQFVQKKFCFKNTVLYPPVDIEKFKSTSVKKNNILSVGRFDSNLNSKKQDVLIEAFKKLVEYQPHQNWHLLLAGGSLEEPAKNTYLHHLQFLSKGYPIEIFVNPQFEKIRQLYTVSKIYWHAAGYQVDQDNHPENTEHFGIAVVEAMASGLVPIVINRGGLPEIVSEDVNGYLWESIDDLISKTRLLIDNPRQLQTLSAQAIIESQKFSKSVFATVLQDIIDQ